MTLKELILLLSLVKLAGMNGLQAGRLAVSSRLVPVWGNPPPLILPNHTYNVHIIANYQLLLRFSIIPLTPFNPLQK